MGREREHGLQLFILIKVVRFPGSYLLDLLVFFFLALVAFSSSFSSFFHFIDYLFKTGESCSRDWGCLACF